VYYTSDTRVPVEKILPEVLELPDPSSFLRRLDGGEHECSDGQERHVKSDEHQQAYGGRRPHGGRTTRAAVRANAGRRVTLSAGAAVSSSQHGRPVTDCRAARRRASRTPAAAEQPFGV